MREVLKEEFFNRPTLTVARELIGKFLVRKVGKKETALLITETEAYDGFKDMASHAHRGQTPRNTPMFGQQGRIYVYFTYGMHWMLNLVCGEEEYPAAVLIRGVGAISPKSNVYDKSTVVNLYYTPGKELGGPARLTKYLAIDKNLNGKILSKKSGLWVEDRGVVVPSRAISRTGRIGVDYSGKWAKKPYRFVLKKSATLSVLPR